MSFCRKLHSFQGDKLFSSSLNVNNALQNIKVFFLLRLMMFKSDMCPRFAMEVEGVYYIAQVKKKEKAWRMYQEAVQKNQTAGHIDVEVRLD